MTEPVAGATDRASGAPTPATAQRPRTAAKAARLDRLPPRLARLRLTVVGLIGELRGSWRLARDPRSFLQFVAASVIYRAQRIFRLGSGGRSWTVRFKDGVELTYRLNRGDIRAIAEVWMAGAYELPFDLRPVNIIDLGANIGAAAVWFAHRYGGAKLVAVEPVAENAGLARINLARLGLDTEVVQAAVGPHPGVARFETTDNSTWGHLSDRGVEVALVTPSALIGRFGPRERIDLVKMDIEGGEQGLFEADLSWLERVDCLVIELHTDRVDWQGIVAKLESHGFERYAISENNLYRGPSDLMAAFRRAEPTLPHRVTDAASVEGAT